MMKKTFGAFLVLLATLALPSTASAASIQFALNHSGCCGVGPFGTVVLSQTVANQVTVTVVLGLGMGFVDTGSGDHPDFAFSLNPALGALSSGDITLLNDGVDPPGSPSGDWQWVFHGATNTSDNLGTFSYSYLCSDPLPPGNPSADQRCGNGGSNPNPGPLQFLITKTGITLASFVESTGAPAGQHHFFVADIITPAGTGLVWADGPGLTIDDQCTGFCQPLATPEPASMMLLGTGLAGLAFAMRRRRRNS